jgi:mannose-6-phosphate isomerase-like protein (cupin superfamily)
MDHSNLEGTVIVYDLGPESVAKMVQVDLTNVEAEPDSPIGNFSFHGCTGGVAAVRGRPPWEFHGNGDELLFILEGESELTVLEDGEKVSRILGPGQLAIVPKGHWHSNNAPRGVTLFWLTPTEWNQHSWEDPTV